MHLRFLLTCLLSLGLILPGVTAAVAQRKVSGRVVAQGTHEPLGQVTVRVVGQSITAVTDEAGRFALTMPDEPAAAPLAFSHLGFQPQTVPANHLKADVELAEQSYLIGEVQITPSQLRPLLLRRWKLDSTYIVSVIETDIARQRTSNPAAAERMRKNFSFFYRSLASVRREYRANGIVKDWGGIAGSDRRRWVLDEATRTLLIDDDDSRRVTVVELTPDRLVVRRAGRPNKVYVPTD
ncbi:carboxypeptidase-like regulatory domain-containing protein [Hymenobacter latericus]|uniref:carboxypeptidase-like regulatory domain-containing protein n=1 Tax=Hymenobacter sp. YIM 151858-1 TaxID=2987688 RepID=UPI002225DDA4|nr:carboxypeptidase-like regulatory domain-containing protein [Hymenobacter sp. YIM 151858-1]UYZ60002.1 carboxypeptidase-like regulatory domain-containing protein [Hymenobacter sp. YIM 151858-1]